MSHALPELLSQQFSIPLNHCVNIISFYDEKATIPFVSRYRKDHTGNLDEVKIAEIYDGIRYYNDLFARKTFIIEEIERKGKLTPELRLKIEGCLDAKKLEDLYLPYKEKKKTKAEKAREAGLEPLAMMLMAAEDRGNPLERAVDYINAEKGYDTPQKAIEGALYIIAQNVMESLDVMEIFLKGAFENGQLLAKKKKSYQGDDARFEDYYEYCEGLAALRVPRNSHRFLAIKRGESLDVLSMKIELEDNMNAEIMKNRFIKREYFYRSYLGEAVDIAYTQYLRSALDTRIFAELTDIAEDEAIKVFAKNLESLLMAPPIPYKSVLGFDPGLRTGIKVAALDRDGTFLEHTVLYIQSPEAIKRSGETLKCLIKKHKIGAISIGNGTGSRETLAFVKNVLMEPKSEIVVAVVDESGASVYSASEIAREEFPDLDVTIRGAISIGRRLQNPLAELVKIDPRSIGVGQYQHDIDKKKLKESLERVIEICVNSVGVDINTASYSILTYISGLSEKVARNLVEHRASHGFFKSRQQLQKVKGIGPKIFEQCAGFLVIRDGENPLDSTRIHPESYSIVLKIAENNALSTDRVVGNRDLLKKINPGEYLTQTYGMHNVTALLDDLVNPLKDPRKAFRSIAYREDVAKLEDVKENMVFEGRITNVTNFGAFIDIGVHNDGLCHVSQMADRFIKNPADIVSVGDIVKVKVLSVDYGKKRIGLKIMR
jgi:protein Tex